MLLLLATICSTSFAQTTEPVCPEPYKVCLTESDLKSPDTLSEKTGHVVLTMDEALQTAKELLRARAARDIAIAQRDVALGEVSRLRAVRSKLGFTVGICGVVELVDDVPIGPGGCYGWRL